MSLISYPDFGLKIFELRRALERSAWGRATMSVTNYPYLFTEHTFAQQLMTRKVIVLDECHSLERQILKFVEISITEESLRKWAPMIKRVPEFEDVEQFADFLLRVYRPMLQQRLEALNAYDSSGDSPEDRRIEQEKLDLGSHFQRIDQGARLMLDDPKNWVFWQEENRKHELEALAKPLDAAPFAERTVLEMGTVRIYMSAYPGSKHVFCDSLGLKQDDVAWLNLSSTFPVENRQIYLTLIGSMSKANRHDTLPAFLRFTGKILSKHSDTKGIIHCVDEETRFMTSNGLKSSREIFDARPFVYACSKRTSH